MEHVDQVFVAFLESNVSIKDDTLLEKFSGWLEKVIQSQDQAKQLLEETAVCRFIEHAGHESDDPDADKMVLALRLGSHLTVTDWDRLETNMGIFSKLSKSARQAYNWEFASVRNAWILGHLKILNHPHGLQWILEHGDIIAVENCLSDSSMFVCKSARMCLTKFLIQHSHEERLLPKVGNSIELSMENGAYDRLLNQISNGLNVSECEWERTRSTLRILEQIAVDNAEEHENASKNLWSVLGKKYGLVNKLLTMLQYVIDNHEPIKIEAMVTSLLPILHPFYKYKLITKDDCLKVEMLPSKLCEFNQVALAINLTSELLSRESILSQLHNRRALLALVWLPVYIFLRKEPVDVEVSNVEKVKKAMSEHGPAISVLCRSLQTLHKVIADKDQNKYELLVALMKRVFGTDQGGSISQLFSTPVPARLHTALINICVAALKTGFSDLDDTKETFVIEFVNVMFNIIRNSHSSTTLVQKAYKGLQVVIELEGGWTILEESVHNKVTNGKTDPPPGTELRDGASHLSRLTENVQRCLCDPKWEVRDTALEFITHMTQSLKQNAAEHETGVRWMLSSGMGSQVWQSVKDAESYVRASAINALVGLSAVPPVWKQLTDTVIAEEIIQEVTRICLEDSEAFARRAALQALCSWVEGDVAVGHTHSMYHTISTLIQDLDWEVKLQVLKFWEDKVQWWNQNRAEQESSLPSYAACVQNVGQKRKHGELEEKFRDVLDDFQVKGGLFVMLSGARDYDQSVQHKACQLLKTVKDLCTKHELLIGEPESKKKANEAESSAKVVKDMNVSSFLSNLDMVDVDGMLEDSSRSIDEYQRNPQMLLQDILTSLKHGNDDDNENNAIIDCY